MKVISFSEEHDCYVVTVGERVIAAYDNLFSAWCSLTPNKTWVVLPPEEKEHLRAQMNRAA